ncbi:rho guanine nucleotide exchange factor 37 [Acanthochromis polyacanthus]|uniref:rho guanine nucleotide exchange factor 37 n=1 Tax=Acanthochromis polyacanthus TaxID=80966 RepID=UPI0022343B9A|nr:rho guanine nucleotide exchange factor 37 [Acanthochromis polyacanthus]XP_051810308.1 rho guanine nucleotide exchange factor 37 [Acanthochromis polyacanthus]XP_051810309.1 rho guanine nucleotide exchange factor 37 [Acanthochromis polyacanthus]XP_051810310.1 rho guanine nucleotide exchange factor 37 [Acanthochromis polyacanthus]XP_051810311.1 rho guanine nucleotide exchange factor 37 [Acanthochromis polyacanthus]XP_051810312.1 rho guanine nucleotide exchange factor 37 [Acanthochromis polyaca
MEVPRRPQSSFTLALPKPASSALSSLGAVEKVTKKDPMKEKLLERTYDQAGQEKRNLEEAFESDVSVFVEAPGDSSELEDISTARTNSRLPSQDSFSEESSISQERLAEEAKEAKKKSEEEAAAAKERAAQRQLLAIEELVQSERNYLRMLQLSTVTIRSNLQKLQPPLSNLDSMFLYIEEVIDVSSRLLSLLDQKQVKPGNPNFLETLCNSFLSLSSDIEAAYKEYLANYNQVTVIEDGYKQKEALWNEIVKVIKASAPEVNATSLSFFLVMPVQRIARYPLLLQTIQKHTDPTHPAYPLLEQTAHTSIALNCRINEYKRFREVADKYKKTETLTIKDKINRLNSHSIAKKTARFSQHFKHETGIAAKLVDEEFDALEGFFYVLENGILELLENVETYLNHLQAFLACKTEEFDFDMDGEKAPICYKEITTALRQWILPTFEKRMRTLIHKPLCALRDLLVGPRNLIRKRLDKLLDYELIEAKPTLSYEEQAVANTYRTMNTLLLNELPQFNGLALQMIWSMLGTFSCLHKDLASDMEQLFQSFAQQLPHSSVHPAAFWEWAESAVLEGARRLETLCQTVQDTLNAPVVQPLSPSSQRRLKQLTDKHGSGKIYQVMTTVVGSRDLDLNLVKGELVAVISEADTRGDKRRWLVDAGGRRGYVSNSKLIRYHQPAEDPPPSPHLTLPEGMSGVRRHSYTPQSQQLTVTRQPCFQVLAVYDFTARGNHEVSVRAGEPVRVLEPHDKRGNPEWSLVEAGGGQRGYVPSNYLAMMPMGTGPSSSYYPYC